MTRYLSIDVGTSAVKVEVLDDDYAVLGAGRADYPYVLGPGEQVEIDPAVLLGAVHAAADQVPAALRRTVDVLCYDTFSPSLVLLRGDGSLAYPRVVTHLDRRSRAQSRQVGEVLGDERFLEITGMYPFTGGSGLVTLLWMVEQVPGVVRATDRVGHLPTWLHHRFTGRWVVDRVNASMLGAYRTTTLDGWSAEVLDAFGLPARWFPDVVDPGEVAGTLVAGAADRLGVPAGIPVTVGTNDMAAAHVGAGNTRPGAVINTAGSSDMVSVLVDRPVTSPRHYLRCAATPGLWQVFVTTAGGFALEWFRTQLCRELTAAEFYEDYLPACLADPDPSEVAFAPYLAGDRQSLERRTAGWQGLTLAATREQMLRAVVAGMNGVLREALDRAGAVVDVERVVALAGGMAQGSVLALRRAAFPELTFEVVGSCVARGNVALAQGRGVLGGPGAR